MSEGTLNVSYVAELSRLKLSPDEIECFQKQLGDIVGYIQQLQKVDLSGVEEKGDAPDFKNNLRADVMGASLSPDQAFRNAPLKMENLLLVPKIVE